MILDWLKSQRRLISERDCAWDTLDRFGHALDVASDLGELRQFFSGEMAKHPVMVMEGSDIGLGNIRMKHWATKLLARAAMEILDSSPGAINYLTVTMVDAKTGKSIDVVFQRREAGSLTPAEKAARLQKENEAMMEALMMVTGRHPCEHPDCREARALVEKSK